MPDELQMQIAALLEDAATVATIATLDENGARAPYQARSSGRMPQDVWYIWNCWRPLQPTVICFEASGSTSRFR